MRSWKILFLSSMVIGAASAANAVDYLAVAYDGGGGTVGIYNSATGALINNIAMTGLGAQCAQFTPGDSLYVSRYQDYTAPEGNWDVAKYSVGDWSLQELYPMPTHRSVGMCYGPDGKLYIGRVDGGFYKLGLATGSTPVFVETAVLGADLRELAANPSGIIYGAGSSSHQIGAYDINANAQLPALSTRTINGQVTHPVSVVLGPDATGDGNGDLYVGYWASVSGQSVIDIYNGQTGAYYGVFDDLANYGQDGTAVTSIKFSVDGTTAYFSCWQAGIVYKKVGSNPAAAFITGISGARGISLTSEYSPGSAAISGKVNIAGYVGDITDVAVVLELTQNGQSVRAEKKFLGAEGAFSLASVPAGDYTLSVTQSHSLNQVVSGIHLTGSPYDVGTLNLVTGDMDGSNSIGLADVSIMSSNYGQSGN